MTVAVQDPINQFIIVGGETSGPWTWQLNADADLTVFKQLASTGEIITLTLGTDYSVNPAGLGNKLGGTINFLAPQIPAAVGDVWTLQRDTVLKRSKDFATSGDFLAVTVNPQMDDPILMNQDSKRDADNALRKNPGIADTLNPLIPQMVDRRCMVLVDAGGGNFSFVMSDNDPDAAQNDSAASAAAALASEQAAAISETNAQTAETNAETAETNAETAESGAQTAETNAETAETNAETAETNAGLSAGAASTSASNAANSETAAGNSETNAQTAENNAETAETNAGISETNAANSETAAGISETNAANSETAAGISETNAAASEDAAEISATSASDQLTGTSGTARTIQLGNRPFTTQADKFFDPGISLKITSDADPDNFMFGTVTSYSGTGLNMDITVIGGSGIFDDWTIRLSGEQGPGGPLILIAPLDTNGFSINESQGAAVASVAQPNIWAGDGDTLHITGTTQIDDFTDAPRIGAKVTIIFDDILIFKNGSGITQQGGADITTAAGDRAVIYADAVDAFSATYFRKSGLPVKSLSIVPLKTLTGQTTVDFTGISPNANQIIISFIALSPTGNQFTLVQLGDAGGVETTGYVASGARLTNSATVTVTDRTDGLVMRTVNGGDSADGQMTLTRMAPGSNQWISSHSARVATSECISGGGRKATDANLTTIRLRPVSGTFSTGSVGIQVLE